MVFFASKISPFHSVLPTTARVLSKTNLTTQLLCLKFQLLHFTFKPKFLSRPNTVLFIWFHSPIFSAVPIHMLSSSHTKVQVSKQGRPSFRTSVYVPNPCLERPFPVCLWYKSIHHLLKSVQESSRKLGFFSEKPLSGLGSGPSTS